MLTLIPFSMDTWGQWGIHKCCCETVLLWDHEVHIPLLGLVWSSVWVSIPFWASSPLCVALIFCPLGLYTIITAVIAWACTSNYWAFIDYRLFNIWHGLSLNCYSLRRQLFVFPRFPDGYIQEGWRSKVWTCNIGVTNCSSQELA